MIIKIQLTAGIVAALTYLFINVTQEDRPPYWVMASVLVTFASSVALVVGIALYRIWA